MGDRNRVDAETAERNRTGKPGGYTFHAPVDVSAGEHAFTFACVRLGDHAHIDVATGSVADNNGITRVNTGAAGHLIMQWDDWLLLRAVLELSPRMHIAEVENPTPGQLGFHTTADREGQIGRLLVQHPEMEVWFR